MFVRSTWGNVVSQDGKGSSAIDLAMRNSTAGIATRDAGVSTMQRATPKMVCVYFLNNFFLPCSGGGTSLLSVIYHHTQLGWYPSFILMEPADPLSLSLVASISQIRPAILFAKFVHFPFHRIFTSKYFRK